MMKVLCVFVVLLVVSTTSARGDIAAAKQQIEKDVKDVQVKKACLDVLNDRGVWGLDYGVYCAVDFALSEYTAAGRLLSKEERETIRVRLNVVESLSINKPKPKK